MCTFTKEEVAQPLAERFEASKHQWVTLEAFTALADGLFGALKRMVDRIAVVEKQFKTAPPADNAILNLQREVEQIKQREYLHTRWRGEWSPHSSCDRNDLVVHKDALWIARKTAFDCNEPGTDDSTWTCLHGPSTPNENTVDLAGRVATLEKQLKSLAVKSGHDGKDGKDAR